jgi:drug/metabolite transporter (DMT)-like permease
MVLCGAVLEGFAQVCLKRASVQGAQRPWLVTGILLFLVEIGLYTRALKTLDVAVAYPLSALSYATVVLAAALVLDERPGVRRWLGVLLIALGAACALPQS